VKRYPPRHPARRRDSLEYSNPNPSGLRRRAHPVFFPLVFVVVGLLVVGALVYACGIAVAFLRGANQD